MKVKSIEEIQNALQPIADEMAIEIVEIEFKQGKEPALTVYIDVEGGVDLNTCEKFHRAIDEPLDEIDPTFGLPYTLNVSSKGIDWAFKTDDDFNSHIGQMVEVKLKEAIKGKKFLEGTLMTYNKDSITLKVDEKTTYTIYLKNTVKVNEYIPFE